MKYTDVKNPKYADSENKTINCWVKFDAFLNHLPFTASPNDIEEHGRVIYQELISGKYGEIEPFQSA